MSLMKRITGAGVKPSGIEVNADKSAKEKKEPAFDLKEKVKGKLIESAVSEKLEIEKIEDSIQKITDEIIKEDKLAIPSKDKERLVLETVDEVIGFGPITPFINNPEITEVMVNGAKHVYLEKNGKIERADITFRDDNQVMQIIEKIVSPLGRRIDESSPMVDARLSDGSRVNAIIPPLSIDGPTLTIRKFSKDPFRVKDLIRMGTLTPKIASFLDHCVKARLNIVVSGGTGSGKTTTLNVLSSFIPANERIVTIEDAAELQLNQEHVVRLETRPANIEGKGAVSIRDLVRNSLRMRPDRIIVGEVRSGEALDMLQAMNTGHDGSLTTGHANSPRDILSRIETMTLMAGMDIPLKAIREQISSAVDLIVHQARLKDGSRRITHITEVQGMEGDIITLQDIFLFKQRGKDESGRITGDFIYTGIRPKFLEKIEDAGVKIPKEIFL